jgi:ABC-type transport system involved in cytochrome bd biosynthesis fused ATPase/permease subunit
VYFSNLPTSQINLEALRANITIIPQVPELLSGTLRQNLDMFEQHDDATLNDALRAAGLFSLQSAASEEDAGVQLGLDSTISSGGGNLSVGQRQVIALARALVRQSKLLILDEATSAIDYETDTIIQTSLRTELKSDMTVLIIAHRLQTIMDADKIVRGIHRVPRTSLTIANRWSLTPVASPSSTARALCWRTRRVFCDHSWMRVGIRTCSTRWQQKRLLERSNARF